LFTELPKDSGSLPSLHQGCDTHSRNGSVEARREVFDGLGGQEVERKKTLRHCRMMQYNLSMQHKVAMICLRLGLKGGCLP